MTLPSVVRLSFVRTNAGPLPGLTCWNSTILKIVPSTSMWVPFLNWLVEIDLINPYCGICLIGGGESVDVQIRRKSNGLVLRSGTQRDGQSELATCET